MAIPLSNQMKTVKAPNVSNVKANDNSPIINQMGQAAIETSHRTNEMASAGMRAYSQYQQQQDAFARNEAEREYNERTTELNTELAQKQGEERQKFQPKYESEMKLASDKYEAAINKVKTFEIREDSKRAINSWNQRNASNYQYENYKNDTNLQEKSMGQALISDNNKRLTSITAADTFDSLKRYAEDPDLGFAHGSQMIRDFYGGRMGLPSEVVEQYVKDYQSKGSIAMANRLAQVTDSVNSNAAYNQSIDFINYGIKEGFISADEGIEAKRILENQKLDMIAELNPGALINADGTYNFNAARKYAPDLTRKELYNKISTAKNSGGNGNSAIQEETSKKALEIWNDTVSTSGWFEELTTKDYKEDMAVVHQGQDNIGLRRGHEVADLVKFINLGNQLNNGYIVVEADGTYRDALPTDKPKVVQARGAKLIQKKESQEIARGVQKAKALLLKHINDGKLEDVFSPTLFKQAEKMSIEDRTMIEHLRKYKQAFPEPSNKFMLAGKKLLNRVAGAKFDTQEKGRMTLSGIQDVIDGVQIGLKNVADKYGVDLESDSSALESLTKFNMKEWTQDEKGNRVLAPIEGMPPVTMAEAVSYETAKGILERMDDGLFHSLYGAEAKKPQTLQELQHYGGYELDFGKQPTYRIMNTLSTIDNGIREAMFPGIGKLYGDSVPALKISDQQIVEAFKKAAEALRGVDATGTGVHSDMYFMQQQFLDKVASPKANNQALSFEEFVSKMGNATPSAYRNYLGNRSSLLNTAKLIQDTGATDKGYFFAINSADADNMLNDMYMQSIGGTPSNPDNIGKDIPIKDVLNAGVTAFKAPSKAFEKPEKIKDFNPSSVSEGSPMFFLNHNSSGYVYMDGQIDIFDANASEFVNLLGILKQYGEKTAQAIYSPVNLYDKSLLSSDFK